MVDWEPTVACNIPLLYTLKRHRGGCREREEEIEVRDMSPVRTWESQPPLQKAFVIKVQKKAPWSNSSLGLCPHKLHFSMDYEHASERAW